MNLRRRFKQSYNECSLSDLDKKGIKYKLESTKNIYGDRVYKVIIDKEYKNGKSRKDSRV